MEAKVRRVLYFNDIEKMDRFCMLCIVRKISKAPYEDDFLRGYSKDIWVLY